MGAYFTTEDFAHLADLSMDTPHIPDTIRELHHKLHDLQKKLFIRYGRQSPVHPVKPMAPAFYSASNMIQAPCLAVQAMRPLPQALAVEHLMGRDEISDPTEIDAHRHTVIELRLQARWFVIELILSPEAWWDQENLMGKLNVERYRYDFLQLLSNLNDDMRVGFWSGIHSSDMHITGKQLHHNRIVDEWLRTFAPTKDYFRVGMWYHPEDEAMASETIIDTLADTMRYLDGLYQHIAWSSDNNFRAFYNSG